MCGCVQVPEVVVADELSLKLGQVGEGISPERNKAVSGEGQTPYLR